MRKGRSGCVLNASINSQMGRKGVAPLSIQDILQEINERMEKLSQYEKEYKEAGNTSAEANARNRRDELFRLKRIIEGLMGRDGNE